MKTFFQFIFFSLAITACGKTSNQFTATTSFDNSQTLTAIPSSTPTPETVTIEGIVADCRHPYGALVGIPNATVKLKDIKFITDDQGKFSIVVPYEDRYEFIGISAQGYVPYGETAVRMVEGAFHLIPVDLYRGVYLVLWNPERSNPQNWHRKWEIQTEFVIVRSGASDEQINILLDVLATDRYSDMTGGRFTSAIPPTIVDTKPEGSGLIGKTVISFKPDIIRGGRAHSRGRMGVIRYSEIIWNVNQRMDANIIWHEMVHTVTAGGHINEWPSVVSEVESLGGDLSPMDIEIFNCIYNSPPMRSQPFYQP